MTFFFLKTLLVNICFWRNINHQNKGSRLQLMGSGSSLETFTLGFMSTEFGIKCSAYLLTLQRTAQAAFQKTTTGANKENLFSGVNKNEPVVHAWCSADLTELTHSLVWQAADTSVSRHCWLLFGQVAIARSVLYLQHVRAELKGGQR